MQALHEKQKPILTKAITAFPGRRDQYQLPLALEEASLLDTLITDIFNIEQGQYIYRTLFQLLPDSLTRVRSCPGIRQEHVEVNIQSALATLLRRTLLKSRKYEYPVNKYVLTALGKQARGRAIRNHSALFMYSYYAYEAFRLGVDRPGQRFLFQVHPYPVSVKQILTEELEVNPKAQYSLLLEAELRIPVEQFEQNSQEAFLANGWVTSSSFTRETLVQNGLPSDNIHVVPYGVDTTAFVQRVTPPPVSQPFTIIFIGQMIQRKGLSYLLDAVRLLKSKNVRLLLCGRGYIDQPLIDHYRDLTIQTHINLPLPKLLEYMHTSNIFVLPSLIEGFGLAIVEAMATGLPVIVTPHTGGADLITDGREGFIVPIRSAEAIAEKLTWAIEHPCENNKMGELAAIRAREQTWQKFRKGIVTAYQKMLEATPS